MFRGIGLLIFAHTLVWAQATSDAQAKSPADVVLDTNDLLLLQSSLEFQAVAFNKAVAETVIAADAKMSTTTDCDAPDVFLQNMDMVICDDLKAIPQWKLKNKQGADDECACRAICASDDDCLFYLYCDKPGGKLCKLWDESQDNGGDYKRCFHYLGQAEDAQCRPMMTDGQNWHGMAKWKPGYKVPGRSQPSTIKRGLGGFSMGDSTKCSEGDDKCLGFSCEDAHKLNLGQSWYYTWRKGTTAPVSNGDGGTSMACEDGKGMWSAPTQTNGENYQAAEFVPLVNGIGQAAVTIDDYATRLRWERANVHFILGYNEPDQTEESHCKDAEKTKQGLQPCIPENDHYAAARDWVDMQKLAESFNPSLKLVSPAPKSNDFDENGISPWLDLFLGNCSSEVAECDCSSLEYIAFHDYDEYTDGWASVDERVEFLERRINGSFQHYKSKYLPNLKGIWMTEYGIIRYGVGASGEPASLYRDEWNEYLEKVDKMFDRNPYMYRYAVYGIYSDPSRVYPDGNNKWSNGGEDNLFEPFDEAWRATLSSSGEVYKLDMDNIAYSFDYTMQQERS